RAFEELRKLGYEGSYSTVRTYLKDNRIKPKAKTVRFETAPGAQAQMDWSTYTLELPFDLLDFRLRACAFLFSLVLSSQGNTLVWRLRLIARCSCRHCSASAGEKR
ncbi:MAG: hypothetical protein SGI77_18520, partial [Pirellulaceae bacterium]|nr:hypothetical protein [Pirellulaceae bacterium]